MTRAENLIGALALAVSDVVRGSPPDPLADALVHLAHCRRPSIDLLASTLKLSHSATVRLVDRLERDGLAARASDEGGDRRTRFVRLTDTGRARADHVLVARNAALQVACAALSSNERAALEAVCEKMLASLVADRVDLYRTCRLCDFAACSACPVAEAAR